MDESERVRQDIHGKQEGIEVVSFIALCLCIRFVECALTF